jgi:multiple sugar transport system substrate-binding protein
MARRPLFWAGLVVLACGAVIVGCGRGDAGSAGKTRIRLSGYTGNPAETGLLTTLVTEFNRSQPDVEAIYEPVPGQYYPKILTMLVARTAPDVFYLDSLYFRPFLAKQILLPLDDYMRGSAVRKEDFMPVLLDAFTDDGRAYGIPKDFNTLGLFYNKRIFDREKVGYPRSTWDLATFREAAKRLTHPERGGGHGLALTHDDADRYLPIARLFGATLFDPAGRCAIDSPQAEQAMEYYAGLKLVDGAAIYPSEVGTTTTYDVFGRGLVAMVFEGSWLIPYLRQSFPEVRYGVSELPAGPAGRSNFLFTVAYVIPRTSAHPELAWRLIEFLTSEAVQERITFALPSRRAVSERYVRRHPEYGPIRDAAAYAVSYEFGPKGDRVRERLGLMVQEVFLGAKDSRTALRDAARDIDRINRL